MPLFSLPPIANSESEVLVLGTMPGPLSLEVGEYYAHPRNVFWRIASELFHFELALPYQQRLSYLLASRIALWDVLQSCGRDGAADAAINEEVANDFCLFFEDHPAIQYVFFNGAKAHRLFSRHVVPQLAVGVLCQLRLPSTSPANARIGFEKKLHEWRAIATPNKAFERDCPKASFACFRPAPQL